MSERWSLLPEDLALLAGRIDAGKLGFAVQLAFWRQHGRFPDEEADVAPAVIAQLAAQIGVGVEALEGYAWVDRSGRRHRVAIIDHLAVAAFDEVADARFRRWLADDVLSREFGPSVLEEELSGWFARSRVTRPGAYRLGRIMRSAQAAYDDAALQCVATRLDGGMRERLGALPTDDGDGTAYARLSADPGRVGLESLLAEIAKLEQTRALALPSDLLRGLHPDRAKRFRRRAAVETAWELRRHPERIRLPLLAFWCVPREAEVVDGLVELARPRLEGGNLTFDETCFSSKVRLRSIPDQQGFRSCRNGVPTGKLSKVPTPAPPTGTNAPRTSSPRPRWKRCSTP